MMKMISPLRMIIAATAIAGAGVSAAAERDVCGGAIVKVSVPGSWQRVVRNGIVAYRAPSSAEALTGTAFALRDPDARRDDILLKVAELERQAELRMAFASATRTAQWIGRPLVLSAIRQGWHGARLQTCWSGEETAAKRKFLSLTSSMGDEVHHFYYTAVGVSPGEFGQRAAMIFGRPDAVTETSLASFQLVRELTAVPRGSGAVTLKPLALPSLQTR